MKALKLTLAISLALNLALGWVLWRTPSASSEAPAPSLSLVDPPTSPSLNLPDTEDLRPLPPDPLQVPALAPLGSNGPWSVPAGEAQRPQAAPVRPIQFTPEPAVSRPYAEPLPSNPHAAPLWERRVPFREDQMERGLYPKEKPEIFPARD
jgi:hypothetical protein